MAKKGDLILISREEYEGLLGTKKLQERKGPKLNAGLRQAIGEYREGKGYGPFDTAEEAISFLRGHRKAKK